MNSDFSVAVHALVYLHHKQTTLSSEELAQNICTNPVRVRRVMSRLHKAGLVQARRGQAHGGYAYPDKERVTLRQIAEVFDGDFVENNWHSGQSDAACLICSGMAGYMDGLYRSMNQTCLRQLEQISIPEVEAALFARAGKGAECPGG